MRFLKLICAITLLVVLFWTGGVIADKKSMEDMIICLQVHSDTQSEKDVQLCRAVIDAIFRYFNKPPATEDQSEEFGFSEQRLTNIVQNELLNHNSTCPVSLKTERMQLASGIIEDVYLPTGMYRTISIFLGKGSGEVVRSILLEPFPADTIQSRIGMRLFRTLNTRNGCKLRFFMMNWIGRIEKLRDTHCNWTEICDIIRNRNGVRLC